MEICDLMNINILSVNIDQVKLFLHTLLGNPTEFRDLVYIFYTIVKQTYH